MCHDHAHPRHVVRGRMPKQAILVITETLNLVENVNKLEKPTHFHSTPPKSSTIYKEIGSGISHSLTDEIERWSIVARRL